MAMHRHRWQGRGSQPSDSRAAKRAVRMRCVAERLTVSPGSGSTSA